MADEDTNTTDPEVAEDQTPISETEDAPGESPAVSGDTGGGTMPWGDKPGT
jgi:hypothetical protein